MLMLMNEPKIVASSNLGLKLANAFGVICRDEVCCSRCSRARLVCRRLNDRVR